MNKITTLLSIGLSLTLLGCGGGNSSSDTKTPETTKQTIFLPKKIAMEIPSALQKGKEKHDKSSQQKNEEPISSQAYAQLQGEMAQFEEVKKELEVNLIMADQIMGDIEAKCQSTPIGSTCYIPSDELAFNFDDATIKEISQVVGEEFDPSIADQLKSQSISLGETTFREASANEPYQYILTVDMSNFESQFSLESDAKSIQTIKWSKDEKRIYNAYSYESPLSKNEMKLNYETNNQGQQSMSINDSFEEESDSGEFHFNINKLSTNQFEFNSNGKNSFNFDGESMNDSYNSKGKLSDQGGFLSFSGEFNGEKFREKETFDANGIVTYSGYCATNLSCNLEDESTWIKQGEENLELIEDLEFIELTVTGGTLPNGEYLLFPPETEINNKTEADIIQLSHASVFVDGEFAFGNLSKREYKDRLDELKFFSVIYPEEPNQALTLTPLSSDIVQPSLSLYVSDPEKEVLPPVPFEEEIESNGTEVPPPSI